jgi:hypothetical protein
MGEMIVRSIDLVIALGLAAPFGLVSVTPAHAINRGYTVDAAYSQQAFLYQASVKAAALAAGYDNKFRDQQAAINQRNTRIFQLRTALRQSGANVNALKGQIDRLQIENTKLMAEFTSALAKRDEDYARELEIIANVGTDLLATEEGERQLKAYLDGGSWEALDSVLAKIQQKRNSAYFRSRAVVAKTSYDNGKARLAQVIALYQQTVAADPNSHWDWVELTRLYQDSGEQNLALGAANSALETARDDRDREVAHNELGNILLDSDRTAARGHYKDSLIIAERLSRSDPENVDLMLDLAISYRQYGDMFQFEDRNESLRWYNKSREIRELVLDNFPNSIRYKGDVSAIYSIIGSHLTAHNLEGGREWLQKGLDILNGLQRSDPSNVTLQLERSFSYERLGDVTIKKVDPSAAVPYYKQSLDIRKNLAFSDRGNDSYQRNYEVSLMKIGLGLANLDRAKSIEYMQEGLLIAQNRVSRNPSNNESQSDLLVALYYLAQVNAPSFNFTRAKVQLDAMRRNNQLMPQADTLASKIDARAAAEAAATK